MAKSESRRRCTRIVVLPRDLGCPAATGIDEKNRQRRLVSQFRGEAGCLLVLALAFRCIEAPHGSRLTLEQGPLVFQPLLV